MLFVKLYVVVACIVALVLLRLQEMEMRDLAEELRDVSQLTGFNEGTIMTITSIFLAIIWPVAIINGIRIYLRRKHK